MKSKKEDNPGISPLLSAGKLVGDQIISQPIQLSIYHCVQTDPANNVWTRAYLIPERNRTVRRQEEDKNYVYLFVFCINLGEINALLTISCCHMKHVGYVIVY